MSLKKILPIILLLLAVQVTAQPIKTQTTGQLLKTASTLLQAQQLEAAEEYYNAALTKAIATKNPYHQAQAYEGLGNIYSKTNQQTQAIAAYQKSVKFYKALGMTVIADVVNNQLRGLLGIGDLYAGVEIGAKGIKLSIIEVKLDKNGENDYTLKLDSSINTDAAALSYQSEKETFDAITIFYNIIREKYEIPAARIHIVISSGLKQELDKYNKVDYFAMIVRPKQLDPKIKINYITVEQEAELSFKGIVPSNNRLTANQLDVGSGNTKGGYINTKRSFIPVTFPLGTKSFQRLLEEKMPGNAKIDDYMHTAEKIIVDSLGRLIVYQFRDKPDFKSRDIIYVSGGIVWAIASLMHPELIKQNHVELSQEDISNFRKLVYSDYENLINPSLKNRLNEDDTKASLDNIKRVVKTYDQKALLSGSIWLEEVIKQVNTLNASKKLIFPRYAYVGWISGYIMDKISKQYTGLAAR